MSDAEERPKGREAARAQRQKIREEQGVKDETPAEGSTRHIASQNMDMAMAMMHSAEKKTRKDFDKLIKPKKKVKKKK